MLGKERHLANIRQLTFGGQNAEAYFSPDGQWLIFQSTRDGAACDQIYTMRIDGSGPRRLSSGRGRTTCAYVYPDGKRFLYASTHLVSPDCPPAPDRSHGYVWGVFAFDIFSGSLDAPDSLKRLTDSSGYDAEATISPDGKTVVFTSDRDGDLELYTMDLEGRHQHRLTRRPGYDGGAFFSPDSKRLVYRADHPEGAALAEYRSLLHQRLVRPTHMEIRVMDADGRNDRQVTRNGKANFAPYFHPDGKRIVFASNMLDPNGRAFELFLVGGDGRGLERVTFDGTFAAFPMFSPDGRKLVFASNRNGKVPHETNVFIADWVE
ncbi:MAG: PD40 domain-containing protein [Candidatus Wallbacteria bacterium]|nr:PD40 domain-containing protein [Candidatus Wallbacteria bacterium]